jgi:UDP-glucose:(heptosyl)LPS alpha-1,3-glucosyltransferase
MKLSFLIYHYFPYGGQQRDLYRIVSECIQRGYEVDVYTIRWQGPVPEDINLILVPVRAATRVSLYKKFSAWVRDALQSAEPSVVFGFNKMPFLDIYFAADPCFIEKAEAQRGAYYKYTSRFRHFRNYENEVFGNRRKTQIMILSPQQREAFEKYYPGCGSRLHDLPPGISLDRKVQKRCGETRQNLRMEFGFKKIDFLLLQIGSGFKVKGVDRTLRAIASLPEDLKRKTRFILIGQDASSKVARLAGRLRIFDQCTILPGRDDIPRFLAASDLMVHPAYLESAGYVLLEATIAGLPVLTTATCGYAFHVEQAKSGLICSSPFNQAELNVKLSQMLRALGKEKWTENGLEYGRKADLYSMPKRAVDLIEKFSGGV